MKRLFGRKLPEDPPIEKQKMRYIHFGYIDRPQRPLKEGEILVDELVGHSVFKHAIIALSCKREESLIKKVQESVSDKIVCWAMFAGEEVIV